MHAIEVRRNGVSLAIAGAGNALMLAADVSIMVEEDFAAMDLRGMNDLGSERTSHTRWFQEESLQRGDVLILRFIETEVAIPPLEEIASDSEQHLADQALYQEQLQSSPLEPRVLTRRQPNATLELSFASREPVIATLEGGREFIALHLLWNQWRPDVCRVSLSSFSQQEALARAGRKQWFEGSLKPGEQCSVTVGA